eukprot:1187815-Prorocentrum_minimum.AAC.1
MIGPPCSPASCCPAKSPPRPPARSPPTPHRARSPRAALAVEHRGAGGGAGHAAGAQSCCPASPGADGYGSGGGGDVVVGALGGEVGFEPGHHEGAVHDQPRHRHQAQHPGGGQQEPAESRRRIRSFLFE